MQDIVRVPILTSGLRYECKTSFGYQYLDAPVATGLLGLPAARPSRLPADPVGAVVKIDDQGTYFVCTLDARWRECSVIAGVISA